ncbi:MAG: histidine phosphatase family protein [Acidobacteriaceae bacterium]|nr:histidine phosphatase family protein [Acidobacteriaceae bacterium]
MTRILLIRHGSTDLLGHVLYGRASGVHLNSEGLHQAELIGQCLKQQYSLEGIYSSPLDRALETANAIAQACGKPVVLDEGITEIDFGEWVGKSFRELDNTEGWRSFNRQRSIRWAPGGESMLEVQARAWRTIQAVSAKFNAGGAVALVSHGDVIRCVLLLVLGMPLDHIHRLEVAPGSVSEIAVGEHNFLVRSINQIFY